jgi:hypothetical protein
MQALHKDGRVVLEVRRQHHRLGGAYRTEDRRVKEPS